MPFRNLRWGSPAATALLPALLLGLLWAAGRAGPGYDAPVSAGPAGELRTVPKEVFLASHNISGWREPQVRQILEKWNTEVHQDPVDAAFDQATRGRVQGINGLSIDVEKTLEGVYAAAAGDQVPLAYREVAPKVGLADLPPGPIYQGNPARYAVSFAINVAWGEVYLPEILRVLQRNGVKATFFLVGQWAERSPEVAMSIAAAEHEIASHGYSPAEFNKMGPDQAAEQVKRAEEAIRATTGKKPRWFSPHKGEFNPEVLRAAGERGYETIMWSVDTVDWSNPGVDWILNRVLSQAHNGAIILMHPTKQTVDALEPMIQGLRRKGYRIVTVGTLLSPSPLARDAAGTAMP